VGQRDDFHHPGHIMALLRVSTSLRVSNADPFPVDVLGAQLNFVAEKVKDFSIRSPKLFVIGDGFWEALSLQVCFKC
jgi:hypothetical protein